MDGRRLAVYIVINAIVSAVVTLLVLSIWESNRSAPAPLPTSIPLTPISTPSEATPVAVAPTNPPKPTLTPTPSGPFVHVIQLGDTLGSLSLEYDVPLEDLIAANDLAEDAILSVGQEVVIPIGGSADVSPSPDATSAPPQETAGPALVVIREIESPGLIGGETVVLTNLGDVINLSGWTLSDGDENRYTFPDVTLFANAELSLHTRSGTNTPSDLYWGESATVWGRTGTVAYLRDAGGKLVATYRVP